MKEIKHRSANSFSGEEFPAGNEAFNGDEAVDLQKDGPDEVGTEYHQSNLFAYQVKQHAQQSESNLGTVHEAFFEAPELQPVDR